MTREQWSRGLDGVLLALTLAFGIVFVVQEVLDVSHHSAVFDRLEIVVTIAFLAILAVQYLLAVDRSAWLRRNWVDVILVALAALPVLRLLRVYRYLPFARTVRLARAAALLMEALRAHLRVYGRGNVQNLLFAAVVLIFVGAILIRLAEEGTVEANIKTLGDALWWAVTTITTVGYGDKFPTTTSGRVLAAGLMLLGIGLFGVITASLSSFFLAESRESDVARLETKLDRLRDDVATLAQQLSSRAPLPAARGGADGAIASEVSGSPRA